MTGFDPAELARLAEASRRCADDESKADADDELSFYVSEHRDAIVVAVSRAEVAEAERDEAKWARAALAADLEWQADQNVDLGVELDVARAALARVEAAHVRHECNYTGVEATCPDGDECEWIYCAGCEERWPCSTVAAVRGDAG